MTKRPKDWNDDDLMIGLAHEIISFDEKTEPLQLDIQATDVLMIASMLQLAASHGQLKPSQREVIRRFVEIANAYFEGLEKPYALEVLRRGEQRELQE